MNTADHLSSQAEPQRNVHRNIGRTLRTGATGLVLAALATALPARAHFQEVIPSTPLITVETPRDLVLALTFTHPMDNGPVMAMGQPQRIGVWSNGTIHDLTAQAVATERQGAAAYDLTYQVQAPGDLIFFMTPAPYWEPTEKRLIVHHSKVIVNAFGEEGGWDTQIGLPVEIEPLTRPYGLWTNNVFQGIVRHEGQPVPFAEVEVEYRSEGTVTAPADPFVTQVIRADANGVFTYAMPRAGWWGFAALITGNRQAMAPDGTLADVEDGGLIWVNVRDMR